MRKIYRAPNCQCPPKKKWWTEIVFWSAIVSLLVGLASDRWIDKDYFILFLSYTVVAIVAVVKYGNLPVEDKDDLETEVRKDFEPQIQAEIQKRLQEIIKKE